MQHFLDVREINALARAHRRRTWFARCGAVAFATVVSFSLGALLCALSTWFALPVLSAVIAWGLWGIIWLRTHHH